MGIICPFCGADGKSRVTDKRDLVSCIRRRRMCVACGKRFGTFEMRVGDIAYVRDSRTRKKRNGGDEDERKR